MQQGVRDMAQVSGIESNDSYTVVIFRGSTAKPLRFSFPRKFVRKMLILAAILIAADVLVISHYVVRTGEVWELSAFRNEALSARQQTAAFSTAVDDLKKRLTSMKEVNQRLRVMLGIEMPKTGDQLNGRGGDEIPLPEGSTLNSPDKLIRGGAGLQQPNAADRLTELNTAQSTELDEQELVAAVRERSRCARTNSSGTRPRCRTEIIALGCYPFHLAGQRLGDFGIRAACVAIY